MLVLYSNVIYALFVALTILFQSIRLKWLRAYILTHVIVSESTTQDLLMLSLSDSALSLVFRYCEICHNAAHAP